MTKLKNQTEKPIGNYLVRQSNQLIDAFCDLTINEHKLVRLVASMIKSTDEEFKEYEFKISDIIKLFGVKDQHKYIEIPKMTKDLMKKVFTIKEGSNYTQLAWFATTKYQTGEGVVSFKFAPDLQKHLLKITSDYTEYQLKNILLFKSVYSFRFYEMFKKFEGLEEDDKIFDIQALRSYLGIPDNIYKQYSDFKKRVILPAQKELNEKTDIVFDFEEIKQGQSASKLRFFIKVNHVNSDSSVVCILSKEDVLVNTLVESFKKKYPNSELNVARALDMISKKGFDNTMMYLDNLDKFIKNDKNIAGLFFKAVIQEWTIPKAKSAINDIKTNINNFDEREYDSEILESFYVNVNVN